jgi:phosphate transport system protein
MWMQLLDIFRSTEPIKVVADEFMEMLKITHQMGQIVYPHIYDYSLTLEQRKHVLNLDVKVNKLERSVRKRIVSHLSLNRTHVPYCVVLLGLVKDAERLGDYVKNISEVSDLGGSEVPKGPLRDELEDLVNVAFQLFHETPRVLSDQSRDRAAELLVIQRNSAKRSDKLLVELAKSDLNAAQATSMVLLCRFHKRLSSHLSNILSSVVMPVHKVDYFDQDYVEKESEREG